MRGQCLPNPSLAGANSSVDWKDTVRKSWLVHDRATMDALLGLSGLTPSLHLNDFPSGHQIFIEGKPANRVYVIISGIVKMTAALPHGRRTVRTLLGPGDVLDTAAVFDAGPHGYTATCQGLVRTAWLNTAALHRLIKQRPQLARRWLQALAHEVRSRDIDIALLESDDVTGRVARQLVTLADHLGTTTDGAVHVTHGLTRQEFSELTGIPKESVSKALANFVARGWIVTAPGKFEITDIEQLRRRSVPTVAPLPVTGSTAPLAPARIPALAPSAQGAQEGIDPSTG
jgi:CRP-like cAMP-binding protein